MSPLLEAILEKSLLFDSMGLLGLVLLLAAALKLARVHRSWGSTVLALGAASLLCVRLYFLLAPHFMNDDLLLAIGPLGISLTIALPPLMLTFGLGGIVWGLWGHERLLDARTRR
ncbi:hypothetical protein JIN84_12535 [Luteolibacter yonseiensis]|uniref:Uncharacterized protein n=1 Tax=Luteolibacter yonseiensis TaxID=1144680 RepID=A0A934R3L9_9BACT|nr:hypothetical protein [Luteolibacter yonseiensis]MBK1816446.1 hypothetical protein [Luteolibacter yonseiensis]